MKKETLNKIKKKGGASLLMLLMTASPLFAAPNKVSDFFTDLISFIVSSIGPGIILLGIVLGGIFIAAGKPQGVHRCVYAIIGGFVITASTWIYNLATGWAS